jgi:nucleotide-binding universal stress UspA family protein
MPPEPLYRKIVAGYEPDERGDDAVKLAELLAETAGAGKINRVHIEHGPAGRGLKELAERGRADLIVLGSTHRAALGSVAPGSVAEHLLAGAPCRIAIAPRGYARARAMLAAEGAGEAADDVPAGTTLPLVREGLRVIAVGFDGSEPARAALEDAVRVAKEAVATIRLIGISEPRPPTPPGAAASTAPAPAVAPRAHDDLEATLHEVAAELPPELRVLPVHERGLPFERLLEHSGEGVDLLVLGSRGLGPVLRVLLGSTSARVIRRAACPVLVVPRSS